MIRNYLIQEPFENFIIIKINIIKVKKKVVRMKVENCRDIVYLLVNKLSKLLKNAFTSKENVILEFR